MNTQPELNPSAVLRADTPLRLLFIRGPRGIVPVDVADVVRFEACDDYVVVHANGAQPLAAMRMNALETQLDPVKFLRIHRSHIVNLKAVSSITPDATGRFLVTLNDGTKLYASRSRSRDLRRRAV